VDHAGSGADLPRVRHVGALPSGTLVPPGYDLERLVGQMYMTLEGIFGTPIDVSSTFIILFTIYGPFSSFRTPGSFSSTSRSRRSAGRARRRADGRPFLLSSRGPSGSGVATTVTLARWPIPCSPVRVRKRRRRRPPRGGRAGRHPLPAGPGRRAFLIAEFLKISYLDVILMATIPRSFTTSPLRDGGNRFRKLGMQSVVIEDSLGLWTLTRRYGFHFTSLVPSWCSCCWATPPSWPCSGPRSSPSS